MSKAGWLRAGIRVKVISKRVGSGQFYLRKGCVEDVHCSSTSSSGSKVASVRLDQQSGLQEIKEKYLETVLPAEGGACLLLVGEYAGCLAVLLEKDAARNRACVQLVEDKVIVTTSMDEVAAVP
jgi:hypothetical protein